MPLTREHIDQFVVERRLPESFRRIIDEHYLPLMAWIAERRQRAQLKILGINGAQGTGKSTAADFLRLGLESAHDLQTAVLSIDDFYLTRAERDALARDVHSLLATRGVPGTHDVQLLTRCLDDILELRRRETCRLPRFDKAEDDRADVADWPTIEGPVDLIILEGWCVGSIAQTDAELEQPVNDLERDEDADAQWRRYANERLREDYKPLFSRLDALIFIKAPDFESVYRWRLEQEQKLAETARPDAPGIMNASQIARFIQFYERITRNNLRLLENTADVVIELDRGHRCIGSRYTPRR